MQRRVREGYVTIVCYIKKCKDQNDFFYENKLPFFPFFTSFSSHLLASNTSEFMLLRCMKQQYCQVIEIIIRIINKLKKIISSCFPQLVRSSPSPHRKGV